MFYSLRMYSTFSEISKIKKKFNIQSGYCLGIRYCCKLIVLILKPFSWVHTTTLKFCHNLMNIVGNRLKDKSVFVLKKNYILEKLKPDT